jgi:preprotein translocase subunit SecA
MPFDKVGKILVKVFGSRNERLVKAYSVIAQQTGEFEEQIRELDDEELKAKTAEFKAAIEAGTRPEDILPEVFAVVREAARRNVDMRHFDVQLIGGNVLYEGKIAEMATGEGKTLVATLATYLVHLTGRKVHIVTVNDYLAKRDAEWMGPVYQALGLMVGAIQADMDTGGDERKGQYGCDITYGTNNEFGFDYLRDNMKLSLEQMVQGALQYAIVDEVDSILVDEARTPLIISGPAFDDVSRYKNADQVARKLIGLQSNYDRIKRQIDSGERARASAQGELAEAKRDKDRQRGWVRFSRAQIWNGLICWSRCCARMGLSRERKIMWLWTAR